MWSAQRGAPALIITGGFSPNSEGLMEPGVAHPQRDGAARRAPAGDGRRACGGAAGSRCRSCMPGATPRSMARSDPPPSPRRSIRTRPRRMSEADILRTIQDYAATAALAREAGYDGVEIMGSEGYLINEFTAPRTNDRTDAWGGSLENRLRLRRRDHGRRARARRARLPGHLPRVLDRSCAGWPDGRGSRRRGPSRRGSRRRHHQPGHRLARGASAHHRAEGAARGMGVRGAAPEGGREHSRHRLEPYQHAGCRGGDPGTWRRRSRLDGAADAGRPGVRQQGARGPCRRDQRVHRLQPGVPRSHLLTSGWRPAWSIRRPDANRVRRTARRRARKRIAVVGAGPRGSPAP